MTATRAALLFLLISPLCTAATIYVPDNQPTIMDAIRSSVGGDTVIVRPGTYLENVDFLGKAVRLKSETGPLNTVIDGGQAGSVVIFQSGEGPGAVLNGFTLTNGTGGGPYGNGGGVFCLQSSPTIINNVVASNIVSGGGGGIACDDLASPRIENNTITGNRASSYGGGIFCIYSSSPQIRDNLINDNSAGAGGGGIGCWQHSAPAVEGNEIARNTVDAGRGGGISCQISSSPVIVWNEIRDNKAHWGGGVHCKDSSLAVIENNTITGNQVTGYGGGIHFEDNSGSRITGCFIACNSAKYRGGGIECDDSATLPIVNSQFIGNSSDEKAGGISCRECGLSLINCLVVKNSSISGAPAIHFDESSPVILNTTISENWSCHGYGGIVCWDSSPTFTNSIVWKNNALTGVEFYLWYGFSASALSVNSSNISGGKRAIHIDPGCTLTWGSGMIESDPRFADPAGVDYHLDWQSPCRDTGDSQPVTELHDFEGDPRIALGAVDMGADEFHTHLYSAGDVIPGSPIDIRTVGTPGHPVMLAMGSGIQDPPQPTPHGDLRLQLPLARSWQIGRIPGSGNLIFTATVPAGWAPGSGHPFQALVGPWGGSSTQLTNLHVLTVK